MNCKFSLGQVVATRGAFETLNVADIGTALRRHMAGDWGDVCAEDRQANDFALTSGGRLLSAFHAGAVKFWIITEADRSATTVCVPDEY